MPKTLSRGTKEPKYIYLSAKTRSCMKQEEEAIQSKNASFFVFSHCRTKKKLIHEGKIQTCFREDTDSKEESEDCNYVPGTTASIHRDSVPRDGGLVVVSWTPSTWTSVDLAAIQPESNSIFPISAIVVSDLSF